MERWQDLVFNRKTADCTDKTYKEIKGLLNFFQLQEVPISSKLIKGNYPLFSYRKLDRKDNLIKHRMRNIHDVPVCAYL